MNAPSIEAVNLSKRYGSFPALSNLNLKIEGSKCVGFLGPNGAGKTTTLKIFTDMIRASEGRALINGIEVHPNKKKALESAGALIESPEIYPSLTPRDRKSTRLNSSHRTISYAVFCLKKKNTYMQKTVR